MAQLVIGILFIITVYSVYRYYDNEKKRYLARL